MHSLIFDVATSDLMQFFENTTSDLMQFFENTTSDLMHISELVQNIRMKVIKNCGK